MHERYNSILKQKAKLVWLQVGDENIRMLRQAIRATRSHNTVYGIADVNGVWVDTPELVNEAFLQFCISC